MMKRGGDNAEFIRQTENSGHQGSIIIGKGGGGVLGPKYRHTKKGPKSIFRLVHFNFSTMKSGSRGGGVPRADAPPPPTVVSRCNIYLMAILCVLEPADAVMGMHSVADGEASCVPFAGCTMTDPAEAFHPHAPCLSQSTGLRSTRLKDVPPPPRCATTSNLVGPLDSRIQAIQFASARPYCGGARRAILLALATPRRGGVLAKTLAMASASIYQEAFAGGL